MKTYKHWIELVQSIVISGRSKSIRVYGGSNESVEDARLSALSRVEYIKNKIVGIKIIDTDYQIAIREEVIVEINENNIITRNRYGALILNSTELSIIDIDSHRYSFWEAIGFIKRDNKTEIVKNIDKLFLKSSLPFTGMRAYETCKGIRLIGDIYINPDGDKFKKMMKMLNADWMFTIMCQKQSCYRARLTPKPYRMKIKSIKYKWPMTPSEYESARGWVAEYEKESELYSTVRLVKEYGTSLVDNHIVKIHDGMTRMGISSKLK